MRWDRLFEDLEDQLASEWEAERAALDTEAERLRLSRVALRDRLRALASTGGGPQPTIALADDTVVVGRVAGVGADWVAMDAGSARAGALVVPLAAIRSVGVPHAELLRSARPPASDDRPALADRMTLGFVLRDAARRRLPVRVQVIGGRMLSGTIDRAGVDHLDLALHEPGAARRADEVTGYRMVPFAAIACVRLDAAAEPVFG
ncbi:MAG: hypothetical protein QM602_01070 [Microbacterium sp.]